LAALLGWSRGNLWIKRDDLTGLAGWRQQVRKLEHTAGARWAARRHAVTTGASAEQPRRCTAAAAARLAAQPAGAGRSRPRNRSATWCWTCCSARVALGRAADDIELESARPSWPRRCGPAVQAVPVPFGGRPDRARADTWIAQ